MTCSEGPLRLNGKVSSYSCPAIQIKAKWLAPLRDERRLTS